MKSHLTSPTQLNTNDFFVLARLLSKCRNNNYTVLNTESLAKDLHILKLPGRHWHIIYFNWLYRLKTFIVVQYLDQNKSVSSHGSYKSCCVIKSSLIANVEKLKLLIRTRKLNPNIWNLSDQIYSEVHLDIFQIYVLHMVVMIMPSFFRGWMK